MQLTRLHATTALLFEDVIIKRLWRSTFFHLILGHGYRTQTFQPGWWVDTQRKTQNIYQTFFAKELRVLLVVPLRFISGESLAVIASAWASDGGPRAQQGYRWDTSFTTPAKANSFHLIFWGVSALASVGLFALQTIICVFNFAFSPSVGMLLSSLGSSSPIHI